MVPKCNTFIDGVDLSETTSLKLRNIYDQLETKLHTNPATNYEIFTHLLKSVKDKHIPKKTVKYKKHLCMKSKWMTNGLL